MFKRTALYAAIGVGVVLLATPLSAQKGKKASTGTTSTTTGQVAAVSIKMQGRYVTDGSITYRLNEEAAAAEFTNVQAGEPAVSCKGSDANCAATNQPATPNAPNPLDTEVTAQVAGNECVFWSGGDLTLSKTSYTQSITIGGANGTKGNWTYTWTYLLGFSAAGSVPAQSYWEINSNDSGSTNLNFSASFAALSAMSKDSTDLKYSFSLLNSDGTYRVSNFVLDVKDINNSSLTGYPKALYPTVHSGEDFWWPTLWPANEGFFPTSGVTSGNSALFTNKLVSSIVTNLNDVSNTATPIRALQILAADTFANNDIGGMNLAWGTLSVDQNDQGGGKLQLPVGDWTFSIAGTVKDLAAGTTGTVNVAAPIKLMQAQSCLAGS